MCVSCFTTAQLATVAAVSARWWYVNRYQHEPADEEMRIEEQLQEPAPTA